MVPMSARTRTRVMSLEMMTPTVMQGHLMSTWLTGLHPTRVRFYTTMRVYEFAFVILLLFSFLRHYQIL